MLSKYLLSFVAHLHALTIPFLTVLGFLPGKQCKINRDTFFYLYTVYKKRSKDDYKGYFLHRIRHNQTTLKKDDIVQVTCLWCMNNLLQVSHCFKYIYLDNAAIGFCCFVGKLIWWINRRYNNQKSDVMSAIMIQICFCYFKKICREKEV